MPADCQDALLKGYLRESFLPPVPHLGMPLGSSAGESCLTTFCNTPVSSQWQLIFLDLLKVYFLFPKGNECSTAIGYRLRVSCLSEEGEAILILRYLEMDLQWLYIFYLYHTNALISELNYARCGRRPSSLKLPTQERWTRRENVPGVALCASDGVDKWTLCCKLPGSVPEFTAVPAVKLSMLLLALAGLS